MLNKRQFVEEVIRVALGYLDKEIPHTIAAEQLLLGTALQESRLTYLRQLRKGPAMGLFQMEPATHKDIWEHYLPAKPGIRLKLQKGFDCHAETMITDLVYAACMCRVHYYRVPEKLPPAGNFQAQAEYYKKYYNTPLGHATVKQYLSNWHKARASRLWSEVPPHARG